MRNHLKLILFFVVASIVFSGVTCSKVSQQAGGNNATPSSSDKTEYPPMPSDVMQADVKALDGTTFKLADKKGTVVLVNLWAVYCGPCIKEMPELDALYSELKGSGFEVLGLNVADEEKADIEGLAAELKVTYPLAWTGEGQLNDFVKISRQQGIPQSFLIDRSGHLRGTFFSASDKEVAKLKETVRSVVKE